MDAQLIFRYFPDLDQTAKARFLQMQDLYTFWNQKINVISRKDMEHLYLRHVLHSLALSKAIGNNPFQKNVSVLDAGTGGGFPGIPLAVLYPSTRFVLCDSIAKKIKVVSCITAQLGLTNVTPVVSRMESLPDRTYDVIISRAVASLVKFIPWAHNKIKKDGRILFLKGGDLTSEIHEASGKLGIPETCFTITELQNTYPGLDDDFFDTKKICEIKQTSYLCAPLLKSS
ncbi:MAG: 16S rRNA (guanine(527)-N(7))-methyltransferase RsmG [Bacteroidales bacterium]|nr:16S rRNA (guanine(527)-N(7))-methyltransferase RsmG [Bacteroidales bacterium]MDD5283399.1 16S rRNA (guanine(527)-N(7))-methyltransferase RsmG [Bacteroidales bacterium]